MTAASNFISPQDFTLITPITKEDGVKIETVTMKEPTAGDLEYSEQTGNGNNGRSIALISRVSGVNPKYVRMLGGRDYTILSEYISSFLEPSPATGES